MLIDLREALKFHLQSANEVPEVEDTQPRLKIKLSESIEQGYETRLQKHAFYCSTRQNYISHSH